MQRFENKVVLVTGAASGIGAATVERLAEEGATLACLDVQADAVEAVAGAARAAGAEARAWTVDIADEEAVDRVVAEVVAAYGGLDVLCNIAGLMRTGHSHEVPTEQWDLVIGVNLTGTFLVTRACLPHLLETQGNIVMAASTSSLSGHPYMLAYAASKGGVLAMTYTLAMEYARRGIRVNAVAPGVVWTPRVSGYLGDEGRERNSANSPLRRVALPEDIASALLFFASDLAGYVTGQTLSVDGGVSAKFPYSVPDV